MRRSVIVLALAALLCLLGAALDAAAQEETPGVALPAKLTTAAFNRELRPGPCATCDTTWVGFVPGRVSPVNWWGIGAGHFRPYSTSAANYGYWGWDNDAVHDNLAEVHGDSLFGWWPIRSRFTSTGGLTLSDDNRPWWAIDIGNTANYVISQGAGEKRTFGVVGVWHRDDGAASGGGVTWSALSGTHSLWCGLRRDGDAAFVDPVTGNPFNARVLANLGSGGGTIGGGIGTNRKFPGYASQWDQIAYRDLDVTGATTIRVRFLYRTNMSTGRTTAAAMRTGWFDKDPLAITSGGAAAGNFISSSAAGAAAPIDSFMVYVGAPVNDAACLYSDGGVRPVYDPQRRWFDEVLQANVPGKVREILSVAGDHASQQVEITGVSVAGLGNTARLAFRSKTNRGYDDEGGSVPGAYSSGGAGAVVIDDVEVAVGAGPYLTIGDFESAAAVNNDTAVPALDAWKSTGRPPAIYAHVHDATDLVYDDLCGPVGGSPRVCNLSGTVISLGDHDQSEAAGGLDEGTAERERCDGIISPTINLRNGGGTNAQGINAAIATATEDWYVAYDLYTGVFDLLEQGNAWRFGFSAWPARQADGARCWSDWQFPPFVMYAPDHQCLQDLQPAKALGLLRWSSADAEGGAAYPDSIRIYLGKVQECYRFGITTGGSPTDGAYFDNVSLAFVDGDAAPMTVEPWQWINDTFTVNGLNRGANAPGGAGFDTTTALIKTGLNIAQGTGNSYRYDIPGDTTVVVATGDAVRIDMVFRINPGPGNYAMIGNSLTSLRRVPTSSTPVNIGAPAGHNFWEEYLLDNGAKGTPAGHPAGAVNGGKRWSNLVWNSARCDTAENNLYTLSARGIGVPAAGLFAATYEESDPKFTKLGIAKNRCFVKTPTADLTQANTVCDLALTDGWPIAAGYVAESGLPLGQTYEYTRILPDGQFTPGTHVEYFFRREDGGGPAASLLPDTNMVFPQRREGSSDAHRWQQFSVLPDAWKRSAYGGLGGACFLVIDLNDRRGNERAWVSLADTLCMTSASKFGAHNGWHAAGPAGNDINNPANFVRNRNEQPGTRWDLYGVKASESTSARVGGIGGDYSNHATSFQIDDKWTFQAPSIGMLEAYYSGILLMSGDVSSGLLGPYTDLGSNDTKILQDFLLGGTSGAHRGLMIEGDGFVESEDGSSLLSSYLYASLRDASYLLLSGNPATCIDLVAQPPITWNGDVYGVRNGCLFTDDVLIPGVRSVPATLYSPLGNADGPLVAGVFHDVDAGSGEYWLSLVDGWDIENLSTRWGCYKSTGRLVYHLNAQTYVYGSICAIAGSWWRCVTDVPGDPGSVPAADFLGLRNNPLLRGDASVDFGLAAGDRLQVRIFDVSGRLIRTIADRRFAPGKYSLPWDGVDDTGRPVARGVYFAQVRYVERDRTEARKLIVLK